MTIIVYRRLRSIRSFRLYVMAFDAVEQNIEAADHADADALLTLDIESRGDRSILHAEFSGTVQRLSGSNACHADASGSGDGLTSLRGEGEADGLVILVKLDHFRGEVTDISFEAETVVPGQTAGCLGSLVGFNIA